jgi:hypothetical protein
VTTTHETCIEARKDADTDRGVSDVIITSDKRREQQPRTPPATVPQREMVLKQTREWVSTLRDSLPSPSSAKTMNVPDPQPSYLTSIPESPVVPNIPVRSQRRLLTKTRLPVRFSPNNTDLWKAPDAWDCIPSSPTSVSVVASAPERHEVGSAAAVNLASLQRDIKRMTVASPKIILDRLKEQWRKSADAALYKELEMEKKHWMLCALQTSVERQHANPLPILGTGSKVLALHECHGM